MKKLKRKWYLISTYKKVILITCSIFTILSIAFLIYVYNSMVLYERNLVDNYVIYLASSGKLSNDVTDESFTVSKYEKKGSKITEGLKKIYNSKNLKVKKNAKDSTDDYLVYDLYNDNKVISTVTLKSKRKYKRMAILTIDEWEIVNHKNYLENGLYSYNITVPVNYKVYINNNLLDDSNIVSEMDDKELERLTQYVEINRQKVFEINNLIYEADIKILDEKGNAVKYQKKDNNIIIPKEYLHIQTLEDAKEHFKVDFDIMQLAKNYSLFLTDDLGGIQHGFYLINEHLIKDSYMYNVAYSWSRGIDITFVSKHRLKNPVFTNEYLKNFIIYNDNAFSVEVYLEKNMVVSGKDKVDTMHDRLYFVYYDNNYRLVDMKAITGVGENE